MKFFITLFLVIAIILNDFHNIKVADETRSRALLYESFRSLTEQKVFFEGVESGDVFISKTQDDAYESNRGQFFYRTGIRLAGMLQPRIIWPEVESCEIPSVCNLELSRNRIKERLGNFVRSNESKSVGSGKQRLDWVDEFIKRQTSETSDIWIFEIFLLTNNTVVALLVPVLQIKSKDIPDIDRARIATISNYDFEMLRPSLAGYCTVPDYELSDLDLVNKTVSDLKIRYWKMDYGLDKTKTFQKGINRDYLFFELPIGVC